MKTLLAGIVLILVIGVAGFMYRNAMEKGNTPPQVACTMEAKICPDGSSVGRTGPNCAFAACPMGNVEDTEHGISYVLPADYVADENAYGADSSLIGAYVKNATTTDISSIVIREYPIPAGQTAEDVMRTTAVMANSGQQAASSNFSPVIINGVTFSAVTLERFEGVVTTAYYLPRKGDVLRFEVIEKNVMNWTDATLEVNKLPEHAALLKMLGTLKLMQP
jgi:hypothetical protein